MIQIAKEAACSAGEILTEHFGKIPEAAVRQKTKNDFLSFVDEASEKKIVSIIRSAFPNHEFLAEEGGKSGASGDYLWIIDPLDGTKNYLSGIPLFAVSIALQYKEEIILGVVYDPLRKELFSAQKGAGAFLNEQPIRVSGKEKLEQSLIATGFPFKAKHFLPVYLKAFEDIFQQSVGMRRMGAAAIDLAYLAAGRFDGFWEIGLSPWDVAAGALIIGEAGGQVSDFWKKNDFLWNNYILASNGRIHNQIMEIIQKYFTTYQAVYQRKEA